MGNSVGSITIVKSGILLRDPAIWYEGFADSEIRKMSLGFGITSQPTVTLVKTDGLNILIDPGGKTLENLIGCYKICTILDYLRTILTRSSLLIGITIIGMVFLYFQR